MRGRRREPIRYRVPVLRSDRQIKPNPVRARRCRQLADTPQISVNTTVSSWTFSVKRDGEA
jgi:hypothetical protein